MSAVTVAALRQARARIADTQRLYRGWEYVELDGKAPALVRLAAQLCDAFDPDWTSERRLLADRVLREVTAGRGAT